MSISRRQFIVGTAAGLILPSYYDKVLSYFENHNEPYLEIPKQTNIDMFAVDHGCSSFQFNVGDPWAEPPEMTIREFAVHYYGSEEDYEHYWDEDFDFDDPADPDVIADFWVPSDSPNAKAFHLLHDLDLGSDLCGEDAVGQLIFYDNPMFGGDYLGVETPCEVTISLLQKRLNELNTGIRISLVECDHV